MGAAIYSWIKTGELKSQGSSISEGIGQGRVTGNLEGAQIDDAFQIPDTEMLPVVYDLLQSEGLLLGGSTESTSQARSGSRAQLGPGKTIVTVLADSGSRYQSKLFNPEFLRSKDLPLPPWLATALTCGRSPFPSRRKQARVASAGLRVQGDSAASEHDAAM